MLANFLTTKLCYGVKVYVPPKPLCRNLSPSEITSAAGPLEQLGLEGGAPMMGLVP